MCRSSTESLLPTDIAHHLFTGNQDHCETLDRLANNPELASRCQLITIARTLADKITTAIDNPNSTFRSNASKLENVITIISQYPQSSPLILHPELASTITKITNDTELIQQLPLNLQALLNIIQKTAATCRKIYEEINWANYNHAFAILFKKIKENTDPKFQTLRNKIANLEKKYPNYIDNNTNLLIENFKHNNFLAAFKFTTEEITRDPEIWDDLVNQLIAFWNDESNKKEQTSKEHAEVLLLQEALDCQLSFVKFHSMLLRFCSEFLVTTNTSNASNIRLLNLIFKTCNELIQQLNQLQNSTQDYIAQNSKKLLAKLQLCITLLLQSDKLTIAIEPQTTTHAFHYRSLIKELITKETKTITISEETRKDLPLIIATLNELLVSDPNNLNYHLARIKAMSIRTDNDTTLQADDATKRAIIKYELLRYSTLQAANNNKTMYQPLVQNVFTAFDEEIISLRITKPNKQIEELERLNLDADATQSLMHYDSKRNCKTALTRYNQRIQYRTATSSKKTRKAMWRLGCAVAGLLLLTGAILTAKLTGGLSVAVEAAHGAGPFSTGCTLIGIACTGTTWKQANKIRKVKKLKHTNTEMTLLHNRVKEAEQITTLANPPPGNNPDCS